MGQALDEFRAAAADCVQAARHTRDTKAAAVLLEMAQKFIELAEKTATMEDLFQMQLSEFNDRQLLDDKAGRLDEGQDAG